MARSKVLCGMLMLAALLGVAQLAADELVLGSGQTITVSKMRVVGGQVHVTLPDGRMQAYRVEDVDLEASGLKAAPKERPEAETTKPVSLSSIADRDRGGSRVSITDEDVAHVRPSAAGEAAEGETAAGGEAGDELIVQVRGTNRSGSQLRVEGIVSNGADFPVRRVELEATAIDAEDQPVGTGRTTVEGEIAPGGSASFSVMVALTGEPTGVNVSVTGALASARVARPEPPREPASGDQPRVDELGPPPSPPGSPHE